VTPKERFNELNRILARCVRFFYGNTPYWDSAKREMAAEAKLAFNERRNLMREHPELKLHL
jgi:hypothetical protein